MREIFVREVEVKGVETFMRAFPMPYDTVGILLSDEDGEGLERGDVVVGGQDVE
jgi:hypothetical protein